MDTFTPEQKKFLDFMMKSETSQLLPLVEVLEEATSYLKAIAQKEQPVQEYPEVQKVSLEGVEVINIPGAKGEVGPEGRPGRDGKDGKNGVDGRDGRDGKDGQDGRDGIDGRDADEETIVEKIKADLPKLGEEIRNALELLPEGSKLDASAIEGLEKKLSDIAGRQVTVVGGGRGIQLYISGVKKGLISELNFSGATYSLSNGLPTLTISGGSGHTIQDEGVSLTARTNLNFVGGGVVATDDAANNATKITISGASVNFTDNEIVSGSGTSWTLAATPVAGSVHVYANGQRLTPGAGNDYTISGTTITTALSWSAGALLADYRT